MGECAPHRLHLPDNSAPQYRHDNDSLPIHHGERASHSTPPRTNPRSQCNMSIHRRLLQQEEAGDGSTTMPGVESKDGHSRGDTPTRLQRENEALRLELQQQQEKLRLLEEQVRLAKIQDDTVRSSPHRSSVTSRRSRKPISVRRKRSGCVGFCEDVLCYANTRTYEQIVESWYSVSFITSDIDS